MTLARCGETVPLTWSGAFESSVSVSAGATSIAATSDTAAGAGRCSARTRTLAVSVSAMLQFPPASVVAVAIVRSELGSDPLKLDRGAGERRAAREVRQATRHDH